MTLFFCFAPWTFFLLQISPSTICCLGLSLIKLGSGLKQKRPWVFLSWTGFWMGTNWPTTWSNAGQIKSKGIMLLSYFVFYLNFKTKWIVSDFNILYLFYLNNHLTSQSIFNLSYTTFFRIFLYIQFFINSIQHVDQAFDVYIYIYIYIFIVDWKINIIHILLFFFFNNWIYFWFR